MTDQGERLGAIVKAYDIRGIVPDQLDETVSRALGSAFVRALREAGDPAGTIVVGYDMRDSSPPLAAAFAAGAVAAGAGVVDVGLGSTDLLYFASGHLNLPGAMFTASHNPAQYNGVKLCRAGAKPIGQDTGLARISALAQAVLAGEPPATGTAGEAPTTGTADEAPAAGAADEVPAPGTASGAPAAGAADEAPAAGTAGGAPATGAAGAGVEHRDLLAAYAAHLRTLVDLRGTRPLRVAIDAGNGMAGHTVPAVLGDAVLDPLRLTVIPLYFELDGTFPHHEANPIDPANLVDLQRAVVAHQADLGLAFDGDADRCFVVDERGEPVSPSTITALVATRELAQHPGATIIHNVITSAAVPEIIIEHGGTPVRSRVGHSFIKAQMAETGAVFGGEHSAHYYFRDFWGADTGMLAAMHVLAALGEREQPLSELVSRYQRYVASGEINSRVADPDEVATRVAAAYSDQERDDTDGLTVRFTDGTWFNLRPSNTEPLLRLNVEAPTEPRMAAVRDQVLTLVRG